jgi:ankyrin repeat protein
MVQLLINAKANVNKQDRHGQTPLFFAPNAEVCLQLGAASANVHALNRKGQTPLHLAAHAGFNDVVRWLVPNMSKEAMDQKDKHGRSAIYCAMRRQKMSTVSLMHESGARIERPNSGCRTPLKTRAASLKMSLDDIALRRYTEKNAAGLIIEALDNATVTDALDNMTSRSFNSSEYEHGLVRTYIEKNAASLVTDALELDNATITNTLDNMSSRSVDSFEYEYAVVKAESDQTDSFIDASVRSDRLINAAVRSFVDEY